MRSVPFEISGRILWEVCRTKETGQWIGVCTPLGICLHADTFEELQSIIAEALDSLFRDLIKSGELDLFMRERGWSVLTRIDPSQIEFPNARLDIPWFVEPKSYRDLQASTC